MSLNTLRDAVKKKIYDELNLEDMINYLSAIRPGLFENKYIQKRFFMSCRGEKNTIIKKWNDY